MAFGIDDAITAASNLIKDGIDKIWPNPTDEAAAKVMLLKAQTDAAIAKVQAANQIAQAQIQVDDDEAKAGGGKFRGYAGIVGVCGFAYECLVQPIGTWISAWWGGPALPVIQADIFMTILGGLLGLGGLHVADNFNKLKNGN